MNYREDGTRYTKSEARARKAWACRDRARAMRVLGHYSTNQRADFLRRIGVEDDALIERWATAE